MSDRHLPSPLGPPAPPPARSSARRLGRPRGPDRTGRPSPSRTGTDLSRPIGFALNADGDLFIADSFNDRVVKLPVRGGQRTVPVAGLRTPAGLAIPSGRAGY
ncbi:NHL repeat-containing protein [Streptomyces globisporus]|uniref:hypothetical protein n=1 Tax=Streptomyces globisporus TaxID=1908 RepID=UPI0038100A13